MSLAEHQAGGARSGVMAGYVLRTQHAGWETHLSQPQAKCRHHVNGQYRWHIANNDFDAESVVSGGAVGIYDGLAVTKKLPWSRRNIPDNYPLTTGLGAYWDAGRKTLTLVSSCASSRKLFYRILPEGVVFSSDARVLLREGDEVDPIGAAQWLTYCGTSGFRTLFRGIRTVPWCFMAEFSFDDGQIKEKLSPVVCFDWHSPELPESEIEGALDRIRDALMGILEQISRHSVVVLLSGGADSGLMACLLKEIGAKDVQLFTCSFGKDDPDAVYSVNLAKKLGYRHTVIMQTPDKALEMMQECPSAYPMAFGDYSTIPSYFIVKQAASAVGKGAYMLDGNGGDDAFGQGGILRIARMQRLCKIPRPVAQFASLLYDGLGLWRSRRFLCRAVRAAAGAVAIHPALMDIAQTPWANRSGVPAEEIAAGEREFLDCARGVLRDGDIPADKLLMAVDLAHICAGLWAHKTCNPARVFGSAIELPYMWPDIIQLGLSMPSWLHKYKGVSKYALKRLLSRYTGDEYVYHPKWGFTPPIARWLAEPRTNKWFEEIISSRQLVRDVTAKIPVERMLKCALKNPQFQYGVYHLIWNIAFSEQWYAQGKHLGLPASRERKDG